MEELFFVIVNFAGLIGSRQFAFSFMPRHGPLAKVIHQNYQHVGRKICLVNECLITAKTHLRQGAGGKGENKNKWCVFHEYGF